MATLPNEGGLGVCGGPIYGSIIEALWGLGWQIYGSSMPERDLWVH
jgi:hypothetical protein